MIAEIQNKKCTFLDTDGLVISEQFHNDPSKNCSHCSIISFLRGGGHLTWPGDLI